MTTKEQLLEAAKMIPDDLSADEYVDRLFMLVSIEQGREEASRGEGVSHAEVFRERPWKQK